MFFKKKKELTAMSLVKTIVITPNLVKVKLNYGRLKLNFIDGGSIEVKIEDKFQQQSIESFERRIKDPKVFKPVHVSYSYYINRIADSRNGSVQYISGMFSDGKVMYHNSPYIISHEVIIDGEREVDAISYSYTLTEEYENDKN